MGCPRCRAPVRSTVFADRRVQACTGCHHLEWEDAAPTKAFGFKHHMRALQEEIREAEKETEDERIVLRVLRAGPGPDHAAVLNLQLVEGDPKRFVKGSTLEAHVVDPKRGIAAQAEVTILQKHKEAVRAGADAASWKRLEGATIELVPRSSAQIQRMLLQAYLLVRRVDPWHSQLEDPSQIPRIPRSLPDAFVEGLRPAQAQAVRAAMGLKDGGMLLVQGPPGTGKTTVIATLVRNLLKQGKSVLVASHTHIAIDNALRRVLRQNPLLSTKTVRLGEAQNVAPDLGSLCANLGAFVDPDDEPDSRPLWRSLYEERPLVGATLDALAHAFVRHRDMPWEPFDTVIVDEAGMNLLPKLAIARAAGSKLVLVGDHQQLPPIVTAPSFRRDAAFKKSPFEILQALRGDLLVLLDEQFRCHPTLYDWSAKTLYEGKIISRKEPKSPVLHLLGHQVGSPIIWADTRAVPGNREGRLDGSRVNPTHVAATARIVEELVRVHGFPKEDVGVIAPFRKQAELYTETVRRNLLKDADVLASTVDAFQGDERQAIVMDLTSLGPAKPHEDPRRLNVSLTRAQDLLVIVGPRPFVRRPEDNPWLWSLQNWDAVDVVPVPADVADFAARSGSERLGAVWAD